MNKVLGYVDDILLVIIILVTAFSFFIGVFLVFFTNIGGEVQWYSDVPLDFLIFGIFWTQFNKFQFGNFLHVFLDCLLGMLSVLFFKTCFNLSLIFTENAISNDRT